jgi:hypothetical protein
MNRILVSIVTCLTLFGTFYISRDLAMPLPNASLGQESGRSASSDESNWYSTKWGKSYRPKAGVVPNETTAASIAEAVLVPIYGDKQIQSQKPFKVTLQNNIWLVEGALADPPEPRGTFVLRLSKVDGKVLFLTHSQ